ncbi:extracellular solute-binding protein [Sulfobacillus thermosulfidooxidans]|uniref:extracellular solute-binding protein n=1 Tax=Sulfobacillus thermosulfidooxidans TaxID=28034 RepID=UPI0006B45216|nr:extracellular solute-binding protein [Sulfobacillus thermosulfidooxidans]
MGKARVIGTCALAGMLAACGTSPPSSTATGTFHGTITLWAFPGTPTPHHPNGFGWYKAMIAAFEKMHPGVKIQLTEIPWSEGTVKLETAVAAGDYPDVAPGGGTLPQFIQDGVIEPINPYLGHYASQLYPRVVKAATFHGKMYYWPSVQTATVLYLNKTYFAERHVPLPRNGMWTWNEFVHDLQRLTFVQKNGQKVYGFGVNLQPGNSLSYGILLSDGAHLLNSSLTQYTFDGPQAVSGVEKLTSLVQKYHVAPKSIASDSAKTVWENFLQGKYAVTAYYADFLNKKSIAAKSAQIPFPYAVANYPIGALGHPITIGDIAGYTVYKQSNPSQLRMSMLFAKFLSDPAEWPAAIQRKYMSIGGGAYPVGPQDAAIQAQYFRNADYDEVLHNNLRFFQLNPPLTPAWPKLQKALDAQLQLIVLGQESPQQGLSQVKRQMAGIIK